MAWVPSSFHHTDIVQPKWDVTGPSAQTSWAKWEHASKFGIAMEPYEFFAQMLSMKPVGNSSVWLPLKIFLSAWILKSISVEGVQGLPSIQSEWRERQGDRSNGSSDLMKWSLLLMLTSLCFQLSDHYEMDIPETSRDNAILGHATIPLESLGRLQSRTFHSENLSWNFSKKHHACSSPLQNLGPIFWVFVQKKHRKLFSTDPSQYCQSQKLQVSGRHSFF